MLETGLTVQVPEYIKQGERIKVNTESGDFPLPGLVSRHALASGFDSPIPRGWEGHALARPRSGERSYVAEFTRWRA